MPDAKKSSPPRSRRLFDEPGAPSGAFLANVDGASRGNPGPAAYAVIIRRPDGAEAARISKLIGRATNNVAEYHALIAALDYAAAHRIRRLRVLSDSQLMVNQMLGSYRVKNAELRRLHENARKAAAGLECFCIEHVNREANREADALANEALDSVPGRAEPGSRERKTGNPSAANRIRAHFWDGVIVPAEPLELADGDKLEISILSVQPAKRD